MRMQEKRWINMGPLPGTVHVILIMTTITYPATKSSQVCYIQPECSVLQLASLGRSVTLQ